MSDLQPDPAGKKPYQKEYNYTTGSAPRTTADLDSAIKEAERMADGGVEGI